MPSNTFNQTIIQDGSVVTDSWQTLIDIDNPETVPVTANTLVPLTVWQAQPALHNRTDIGVWLTNDTDLSDVAEQLLKLPVIAIDFPGFMDGRGFSLARLLRERYQYGGEIRAIGHIIRDQLCYLKRCGFNAFTFAGDVDVQAAVASLTDFTEAYQTSVDMPRPLFRRRA